MEVIQDKPVVENDAIAKLDAAKERRDVHLEAFQSRLAERLKNASKEEITNAKLGLMIGDDRWLVDLAEAGEIVPVPSQISSVPMTKQWFKGMANLRGTLHTVTDLAQFADEGITPINRESRLLSMAGRFNVNASIVVTKMLGLRTIEELKPALPSSVLKYRNKTWAGAYWRDAQGLVWRDLVLSKLALDENFILISR
jgi:twitching motility protein PilI